MTLVWWTPEFLSPEAPQPAGPILAGQMEAFSAAQGGQVRVDAVRKARYGKGGLLDALRSSQPVAPDMLPDIIALDVAEVEKAVEAGLLQPLDGLLDSRVTESLYPFASEAGLFHGKLYAVQYLADVDHATYLPAQIAEPPANWIDLLARRTAYLFPIGRAQTGSAQGSAGQPSAALSHAVLGQYLSAGATLAADRRLLLEPQPLLKLLAFYADAAQAGVLTPSGEGLADEEETWNAFSQGQGPLAYVSARQFLGRGNAPGEYAPTPGADGPAPSLASGWALAIVTRDPARQQAAAEFLAWLLEPENAGAWTARAGWLPTSSDALELVGDGPYMSFLDSLLAQARSLPAGTDYAGTAERIRAAIEAVLAGKSDPASAVDAAINGQ